MTDKERQKQLIEDLHVMAANWVVAPARVIEAAEEIERLTAENKKLRNDIEWDNHVRGVRARKRYD
jgi:hypothetical protein